MFGELADGGTTNASPCPGDNDGRHGAPLFRLRHANEHRAGLLLAAGLTNRQVCDRRRWLQKIWRNSTKSDPAISMAAGRVITQANAMFLIVLHCRPDPLAAMVPATPLDRTCVVETGRP